MAIKANTPRNPKGPAKEQKDHYSPTRRLDDKVKSPASGKIGESYKKQQKASPAGRSNIGCIGSEHENVSGLKSLAVTKNHSAYQNQEHAATGMHGGPAGSTGDLIGKEWVGKKRAYAEQSHAKDGKSSTDLHMGDSMSGKTGDYMGHFRNEKYLRQGHNSDGTVPLGPGEDASPDNDKMFSAAKKVMGPAKAQSESENEREGREAQEDLKQAFSNGVRTKKI